MNACPTLCFRNISEVEAEGELEIALALPSSAALCEHFAEGGACRIESDIGAAIATAATAPIGMIDEVKGFGTKLEAKLLADGKGFEQAEIPVLIAGLIDEI